MQINVTSCKHHLVKVFSTEKAKNGLLGAAIGSGGSLSFLLVDAVQYGEITAGPIFMIGFMSFGFFIAAIASSKKVKA